MTSHTNRITPPFSDESTAQEVLEGVDLSGKRAVVTGGSSGIGLETARALAGAGAEVTLAVRSLEAGERAASDITQNTGNQGLFVMPLDLADQSSVAAFVDSWEGPLDILVNNAGVMDLPTLLSILYKAVERYGAPEALVTDSGSVFLANRAKTIYSALGIEKHEIEKGKPWQNYSEAQFGVQKRMADHYFELGEIWPALVAAHDQWIEDYNVQRHFAHEGR